MSAGASFEEILIEDVFDHLRGANQSGKDKRATIRSIYAAVEGHLTTMQTRLSELQHPAIKPEEVTILRDEMHTVSERGQLKIGSARLTLKRKIRFTMNLVARINPEGETDFNAIGWTSLINSLDVRDRLTHPKAREDLDVSAEELEVALHGMLWFFRSIVQSTHASITKYQESDAGRQGALIRALEDYAKSRPKLKDLMNPNFSVNTNSKA